MKGFHSRRNGSASQHFRTCLAWPAILLTVVSAGCTRSDHADAQDSLQEKRPSRTLQCYHGLVAWRRADSPNEKRTAKTVLSMQDGTLVGIDIRVPSNTVLRYTGSFKPKKLASGDVQYLIHPVYTGDEILLIAKTEEGFPDAIDLKAKSTIPGRGGVLPLEAEGRLVKITQPRKLAPETVLSKMADSSYLGVLRAHDDKRDSVSKVLVVLKLSEEQKAAHVAGVAFQCRTKLVDDRKVTINEQVSRTNRFKKQQNVSISQREHAILTSDKYHKLTIQPFPQLDADVLVVRLAAGDQLYSGYLFAFPRAALDKFLQTEVALWPDHVVIDADRAAAGQASQKFASFFE